MFFYLKKLFQSVFQQKIYLDHASTTPMDPRVFSTMKKQFKYTYGNAGGLYDLGIRTKEMITASRKGIAQRVGVMPNQVIFTRGGTEANNIAILGTINHFRKNNPNIVPHIITTNIEHDSVLQTCKHLEQSGQATVTFIPCDREGIVSVADIKKELRPETVLVTVMYANNEIGTVQPIQEIAKLIRWYKKQREQDQGLRHKEIQNTPNAVADSLRLTPYAYPLFHTDAVQAVNYFEMYLPRLGVDMLTLSGSKMYGPKSAGLLIAKSVPLIDPIMFGGGQEFGIRPGTEDVALIAGIAKAFEIAADNHESEMKRLTVLRDYVIAELLKDTRITLNGSATDRLPNNINISVSGFSGEQLVLQLNASGFAVSAKSACQSDNDEESHVIKALRDAKGITSQTQEGSLRITVGRGTTKGQMVKFIKAFRKIIGEN